MTDEREYVTAVNVIPADRGKEGAMSKLLEEFKQEKEVILGILQKIGRMGVHTMEGRSQLIDAKNTLMAHLNKQVGELYPELGKAAQSDPGMKLLMGHFENELKEISAFCTAFFEKYAVEGGGISFLKDFEKLKSALESRMQEQESLLEARDD